MALGNWGPVLLVTGGRLSSLNSSGLAGEKGRKKGGGRVGDHTLTHRLDR